MSLLQQHCSKREVEDREKENLLEEQDDQGDAEDEVKWESRTFNLDA